MDAGMMYASRSANFGDHKAGSDFAKIDKSPSTGSVAEDNDSKFSVFDSEFSFWSDSSGSEDSGDELAKVDKTTDKQRLAQTLNNWCLEEENTAYMLQEGGLEKLIALSGSNDRKIKKNCAQAFNRLCSRGEEVCQIMLDRGIVGALVGLAYTLRSPKRGLDCAEAIVSSEKLSKHHGQIDI